MHHVSITRAQNVHAPVPLRSTPAGQAGTAYDPLVLLMNRCNVNKMLRQTAPCERERLEACKRFEEHIQLVILERKSQQERELLALDYPDQ